MIKVLHIVNRFNLGGHIFKPLYLAKYLPSEYKTLVIGGIKTEEEESGEFLLQQEGIDYLIIPEMSRSINLKDDYKAYKIIKKIIKDFQPDIIHTHASKAGLLGRLAAFTSSTKIVFHTFHGHVFHSYFGKFKTSIFKTIEKVLAYKTTAIIAVSELQKKDLCYTFKVANPKKTFVVPIGLDLEKFHTNLDEKRISFRKKYNIEDDEIMISIVGRLVPIKNHHLLIESIYLLKQLTTKKIKIMIVGDGALKKELIELCREKGLTVQSEKEKGEVIFTSWLKEVDYVYAASDIVTLTSFNEGTPVAIIEAQVAMKPIVSTDAGGTRDILGASELHKVANLDAVDFSQKLLDVIQIIESNSFHMTAENKNKTLQEFSYQTMTKRMDMLYKQFLN